MIRVELDLTGNRGEIRMLAHCHVAPAPLELARATILTVILHDHINRIMALTGPALADWLGTLPLEHLELEPGHNNPLVRAGYTTISQLTGASAPELLAAPRFGLLGLAAVERQLARFGLALRRTVAPPAPRVLPSLPAAAPAEPASATLFQEPASGAASGEEQAGDA